MNKLALGTAQFGMDYGINNKRGKIPKNEAFKILHDSLDAGIDVIDTAFAYGESEAVIGEFLERSGADVKIVSKLSTPDADSVDGLMGESLKRLNRDSIYGCLMHSFAAYEKDNALWDRFRQLKKQGKAERVGFSVYYPSEIDYLLDADAAFDIIQIPASIFDQRFFDYLPRLKQRNVEVHARSVFLQGLVYKKPEELGGLFSSIKSKVEKLYQLSKDNAVPIGAICLMFIAQNPYIDKVIIGVDNRNNLQENISYYAYADKVSALRSEILSLRETDEDVIVPANWSK